jgi:oxygen-independent coproporphyrinogen III oxidase
MDAEFLQRYDVRVPRYTSYPTAPNFHAGVAADSYRSWLAEIGQDQEISLYFHVPFCAAMCWYCGCHTRVVGRYGPIGEYAGLLAREVALVAGELAARPLVSHVHWGGGTPNMLSPEDFSRLMEEIRKCFTISETAKIAVEIDPRSLTGEKVDALAAGGVNRASLGVQDFTHRVQRAINREQSYQLTAETVAMLRAAGIAEINFDLMYGLPHQTVDDVIRTVDQAVRLAPDRLAVFGYAHVPWMKSHQKMIDESALPDTMTRFRQSEAVAERLAGHGYRRIGLDHFVRPGDAMADALERGTLKRNFQGYTTDRAGTLLGFGASAIGALDAGYVQNAVPFGHYADDIRAGKLAVRRGVRIDDDDRLRRAVIERLMCDLAVELDGLRDDFGVAADYFAGELTALEPMRDDGVVEIAADRIRITERGRPLMRNVCAVFDRYLDAGPGRHSRAV